MRDLIARIATELVVAQIHTGAKHPSPGLIKEAVETAKALAAALEEADAPAEVPPGPPVELLPPPTEILPTP